jgi:hypothetical protein
MIATPDFLSRENIAALSNPIALFDSRQKIEHAMETLNEKPERTSGI